MGKTLVINMKDIVIEGDILDVAGDTTGIIYNISKEIDDEISVDYVDGENKSLLKQRKYGACTFFFNLNKVWGSRKKDRIIKEISQYLNKDGEIYVWDINKEMGEISNNKVMTVLPSGKIKEFEFKNLNPISKSNIDDTKKLLSDTYSIKEEKLWEDIFFIKGEKIK